MSKLKNQIDDEISINRQKCKRAKSSTKHIYDLWLQSLQRIKNVCKERNRF